MARLYADDGDTVLGTVSLGNGYTVYASRRLLSVCGGPDHSMGTRNALSTYPMDTAIEFVELTTGNRYTYSQIKNDLVGKDGKADAATKLEISYLGRICYRASKRRTNLLRRGQSFLDGAF